MALMFGGRKSMFVSTHHKALWISHRLQETTMKHDQDGRFPDDSTRQDGLQV